MKPGYLAAVREFTLAVDCLDEIESPLLVQTEIVHGNEIGLLYAFAMESSGSVLLSGRVSVFLPV
ncbi:3-oxoacyl-[acyl-carrier-protein] reductase [Methylocaldum marinum]|uniref:3-oxoacyl-[acyl-carrier-protein] reductase n=1 Tax=Methylocaldum marinum TaxID=1432792 RepID=A0A250KT75_9GAMM|nr:3-oxoacyl-[acyl-carrier-protein] reductase [Methylocaldum marinum]